MTEESLSRNLGLTSKEPLPSNTPKNTFHTKRLNLFFCLPRPNFIKPNHQGFHKRVPFSQNTKLLVRQIPPVLNNISKLNEHFSKFGTIVNLQVSDNILLGMAYSFQNRPGTKIGRRKQEYFGNIFILFFSKFLFIGGIPERRRSCVDSVRRSR